MLPGTHIADHLLLRVGAGLVEGGQEGLQMLGAVVFAVKQQHGEELGGSDLRGHQPVAHVVANGWNQPAHVSQH